MYAKLKVINLVSVVLISGLMLSLSVRKETETWHSAPDKSTSKIRLITHLQKNQLQLQFIRKILQKGLSIDTIAMENWPGHLWSTVGISDNYYIHFLCETTDSIETVSGEFGGVGLNGIGKAPTANNIAWTKITYNSNGWLDLTMFAQLDGAIIEYNSTL
jgi:hypothetical protein